MEIPKFMNNQSLLESDVDKSNETITLTKQQLENYRARVIAETVEKFAEKPVSSAVDELPPLPKHADSPFSCASDKPVYSAAQMRDYARAALSSAPSEQDRIDAIRLSELDNTCAKVSVSIGGKWIDVIESSGGIKNHIVERAGINSARAAQEPKCQ